MINWLRIWKKKKKKKKNDSLHNIVVLESKLTKLEVSLEWIDGIKNSILLS